MITRLTRRQFVYASVGLAAVIAALWHDVDALLAGWLVASITVTSIAVGALAVLMLTYLVRGGWTDDLHLPLTAAALTTPLAGLLFIPVLFGMTRLYPWASGPVGAPGSFKAIYLTPSFFVARTLAFFAIWTALALWIRAAWHAPSRMVASAAVGLMIYALTASFASVDWLESLSPHFHSSVYGLMLLTDQMLAGFSFALAVRLAQADAPLHRYGAILFALLLMWAYNQAMQYIVIWSGDIPDEVVWYAKRESGAWGVILWSMLALQFFVPFFAMLSPRVRNQRMPLLALAILTVALRPVEVSVLVVPELDVAGSGLALALPAAGLLIGAVWWMAFATLHEWLRRSSHDLLPLSEGFDVGGSPKTSPQSHS